MPCSLVVSLLYFGAGGTTVARPDGHERDDGGVCCSDFCPPPPPGQLSTLAPSVETVDAPRNRATAVLSLEI
ncbi:hypothetical protein ACI65C_010532 [Semiaphis heraclei]